MARYEILHKREDCASWIKKIIKMKIIYCHVKQKLMCCYFIIIIIPLSITVSYSIIRQNFIKLCVQYNDFKWIPYCKIVKILLFIEISSLFSYKASNASSSKSNLTFCSFVLVLQDMFILLDHLQL